MERPSTAIRLVTSCKFLRSVRSSAIRVLMITQTSAIRRRPILFVILIRLKKVGSSGRVASWSVASWAWATRSGSWVCILSATQRHNNGSISEHCCIFYMLTMIKCPQGPESYRRWSKGSFQLPQGFSEHQSRFALQQPKYLDRDGLHIIKYSKFGKLSSDKRAPGAQPG